MMAPTAVTNYGRRATDSNVVAAMLSPQNPIPHLAIVLVVILCSTYLAAIGHLNDAFIGIAGAAIGASGTALAVQRHQGQVTQAVQAQADTDTAS